MKASKRINMRSLFLKIFLWFWLASILIIVSTLVLLSVIEPYRPFREDGRHIRRMTNFGRTAVDILESEGPSALQEFINRRERRPGRHGVFLFDENSKTVTGRQPPPDVRELAGRARKSGITEFKRRDKSILLAQTIYGPGGNYYIMVGELSRRPRPSPVSRLLNPRFLSLRLLVIFIVASIFCYWLARYLAGPVSQLRTATRQLASGDLKTRVGSDRGGRRDEIADLGRDFDLMAERIESLMSAQSRLLRDVSHELRSPLARLNVALELARQRSGSEARESLARIERESERLNKLIGQLRTLTLLESGAENIDKKTIDISSLIKGISDDADFEARSRQCSVKAEIDENIMIEGSEEHLRRAIENVVRNAVRYTDKGTEVEILLQHRELKGKESAVLKVRDHGPGVPEEALANLFSPFYRVAESRDRKSGGMGIGLAITDRAVSMHGGTVHAENAQDRGLIIRIDLPVL
jgi:two-component system sensor histidine kinase CpxA